MGTLRSMVVILALALGVLSVLTSDDAAGAGEPVSCDAVAQPGDSARTFIRSLAAGQTGCLRGGTYSFTSRQLKMERPDVTLTSYPGERAKLVGRLWVARSADRVTVSKLDLSGRNSQNLPSPTVNAAGTVWRGLDVTNGHAPANCFHLGSGTYGNANRTLIEGSRIHNCGRLPAANHHHGIYVLHANGSVIRENLIYDNADRGVNFYPNARRVRVTNNVIDGNGEGVMYSGGSSRAVSSYNVVSGNVIANSKVRYNVESYWSGRVGKGNRARRNCVFASNTRSSHYNAKGGIAKQWGFKALENVIADPQYVDRAAKNFSLSAGSGCAGYGPTTSP